MSPHGLPRLPYDIVVIGAGVAGLAVTLRLPPGVRVALLTKGVLGESNTRYAQGGLAAAVGADDSPALHEADTLAAGAGLCDPEVVRTLVEGGPTAVRWLLEIGARFDRAPGENGSGDLLLGREAAHSRRRVLHAGGDATGAEIERSLVAQIHANPNIDVYAGAFALDLVIEGGRCTGVIAELTPGDGPVVLEAPIVTLAAGGAGQLWAVTSNPAGATADGLAMAIRAGVAVADLEFAQFHPTVLAVPGTVPFLVSEAVRGEGAYLRAVDGARFMTALHPLAELAPRDVVARAIQRQMGFDGRDHVSLDLRHLDPDETRARFPTIGRELASRGLDLTRDLLPVAPAAHYFMGGIVASATGETSLPGLLALGEASCTGVHGANRLASNSLLEGLVFGLAAADRIAADWIASAVPAHPAPNGHARLLPQASSNPSGTHELRVRLQRAMSRDVAVVRDADGLSRAVDELTDVAAALTGIAVADRNALEVRNMALAAAAIAAAATRRHESRGAHFRADHPETDTALDGMHLVHAGAGEGWRYGGLARRVMEASR
ncbi:MAG: L-aspartate oxidase [Chloroflexia bacterium]|nr:L-aspartate oxidase [Chloroflexia bacterium]